MSDSDRLLLDRRRFLRTTTLTVAGVAVSGRVAAQGRERPPQLEPDRVHEFVRVAHNDLDAVQAMLEEEPNLLNATWDWGGGDFEAAIGGAGHMGRRDIAMFLLDRGARLNIFVAAMLGQYEMVKGALDAMPELLDSKGPHGISLIRHAEAGGEEAVQVLEYLQSLEA
jgi:hypothetical protein